METKWQEWAKQYKPIYHEFTNDEGIKRKIEVSEYQKGAIDCGAMKVTLLKYMKANIDRRTGEKSYEDCIQYYFPITQQKNPKWQDEWAGVTHLIKENGRMIEINKYGTYKLTEYDNRLKKEEQRKYMAEKDFQRLINQGE